MARRVRQHCAHFLSHVTPLWRVERYAFGKSNKHPKARQCLASSFYGPLISRAQERWAMITDKLGAVSTLPGALRQSTTVTMRAHGPSRAASSMLCERSERADNKLDKATAAL